MLNSFGAALKEWRGKRRISQLELGLAANVSARHISFLETGRASPSKAMVMMLGDTLELPHSERNAFLNAAGFAPAYRRRTLEDAEMEAVLAAVNWTLDRHEPFPALAIDRHWKIVRSNRPASFLLGAAEVEEGDSLLDAILDEERFAGVIENWSQVAHHMVQRLRTESAYLGGDPVLDEAISNLSEKLQDRRHEVDTTQPAIIPTRYRTGDGTLSFFSTIAQFGTPEDLTLAELRIEMLFPADDVTKEALFQLSGINA